jgi:glycine oxidase
MAAKPNIVVAGAGVIGSTIALVLARAGSRVTLMGSAPTQATASGVAAGMLAPACEVLFDETSRGHFELLAAARDLWPAMAKTIGLPLAGEGALAVGDATEVSDWADRLTALGAACRKLRPQEVPAFAPRLRTGACALLTAEDFSLDAIEGLARLRRAVVEAGASVEAGTVTGAQGADLLVIATGAAQGLVDAAPELARLTPIKGHILRSQEPFERGPVVRAAGVYLCPMSGRLILGASMEVGRDDDEVDPAVVAELTARGEALAPSLARFTWRAATGVRAATPDGLPMVGFSRAPGVVLAVGARRNGWLLAPMIARVVADLAEGRAASAAATLFDPARFDI